MLVSVVVAVVVVEVEVVVCGVVSAVIELVLVIEPTLSFELDVIAPEIAQSDETAEAEEEPAAAVAGLTGGTVEAIFYKVVILKYI